MSKNERWKRGVEVVTRLGGKQLLEEGGSNTGGKSKENARRTYLKPEGNY